MRAGPELKKLMCCDKCKSYNTTTLKIKGYHIIVICWKCKCEKELDEGIW